MKGPGYFSFNAWALAESSSSMTTEGFTDLISLEWIEKKHREQRRLLPVLSAHSPHQRGTFRPRKSLLHERGREVRKWEKEVILESNHWNCLCSSIFPQTHPGRMQRKLLIHQHYKNDEIRSACTIRVARNEVVAKVVEMDDQLDGSRGNAWTKHEEKPAWDRLLTVLMNDKRGH